ncbi:hypothetical protein EVAR_103727_1 [Eumeta japonica]|uniref:Uncharacterized protein n=1 Tax=Eumeta variegata TaxID=151549 RepID=A0A4C1ZDR1_EUMVA|nr:hypothetical protein EVAR_103727_1 [Eumeta japonica]
MFTAGVNMFTADLKYRLDCTLRRVTRRYMREDYSGVCENSTYVSFEQSDFITERQLAIDICDEVDRTLPDGVESAEIEGRAIPDVFYALTEVKLSVEKFQWLKVSDLPIEKYIAALFFRVDL